MKSCPLADIPLELIERSAVRATALVKYSPLEKNLWCYLDREYPTMLCSESRASETNIKQISEREASEMNRMRLYKLPASLWPPSTKEVTDVYQGIIFRKNKQGQIYLETLTALRNW